MSEAFPESNHEELVISDRINHWKYELARAHQTGSQPQLDATITNAEEELNTLWPHYGKECTFSGVGRVVCNGQLQGETVIDFDGGESLGFRVVPFGKDGTLPPVISYLFRKDIVVDDEHRIQDTYLAATPTDRRYYDVFGNISETNFHIQQELRSKSEELVQFISSRDFRWQDAADQRLAIESFISGVTMTAQQYGGILGRGVVATADYVFATVPYGPPERVRQLTVEGRVLQAACRGLGSLLHKQMREGVAVKPDDAFHPLQTGLSLVLEADAETLASFELDEDYLLYLPLSGQATELDFVLPTNQ
ncbi:MAG: hypothetical protein JWN38_1234 [Candidatus Saccharibacteria bacterium]|nr:hypothetical protein [Candidatus Saccharibacteria bacterium]